MIEHLESRIAPAAVLTFTEVDGDKIKITTSKGNNAELAAAFNGGIGSGQIGIDSTFLDLTTSDSFNNSNVTFKVIKKGASGDGLADDVTINGYNASPVAEHTNIYLKNVNIQGNLTAINVGDEPALTVLKSLTVVNWGPATNGVAATASMINGDIGSILVKGDFNGYIVSASDYTNSDVGTFINSFTVRGAIAGASGDDVGHIQVSVIKKLSAAYFFGPDNDGFTNNGLIEAIAINRLGIGDMEAGAQIDLALDTAPSQAPV